MNANCHWKKINSNWINLSMLRMQTKCWQQQTLRKLSIGKRSALFSCMKSRAHAHSKIELKSQVFWELQRALVLMMNRPQEYTNVRWKIRKKTVRIRWLKNTMVLLLHGRLAVNNNNNNNKSYSEFCFTIERKKNAHIQQTTNSERWLLVARSMEKKNNRTQKKYRVE